MLANENLYSLTAGCGNYSSRFFPEHCMKLQILLQADISKALEQLDCLNSVVDRLAFINVPIECYQTLKIAIDSLISAISNSRGNPDVALRAAHSRLDHKHAEDFFVQVEQQWDNPRTSLAVTPGLELGAYIFDRMYRDLYTRALSV